MSRQSLTVEPLTEEQTAKLADLIAKGWTFRNETRNGRQRLVGTKPDARKRPSNDRRNSE